MNNNLKKKYFPHKKSPLLTKAAFKNSNDNEILQFNFKSFSIVIHSCQFPASLPQSSVSHDPSEIILIWWFVAKETFIVININVKTVVLLHIFVDSLINVKFERTAIVWNRNLYRIWSI